MLQKLTNQVQSAQSLNASEVGEAVRLLTDGEVEVGQKAEFLSALAKKGETVEEIAAFAGELRSRSIAPPIDQSLRSQEILDVCGTGGDRLHTFNISTTVSLVASAAGVIVAKHGNRAVTSQAGSADVLEALGIRIDLSPADAARSLREHGFAFFFAPHYHPAFKHIAPARKLCAERGQRTIFNFMGPLLNPARPSAQLIGVPRPEVCQPLAHVLQSLGIRRGMVVSGCVGTDGCFLDELSTLGETSVAEFYHDRGFNLSRIAYTDFPVQPAQLKDLSGSDAKSNAEILRKIIRGEDKGPKRDAVLLNSAAALFVAGKTRTMSEGWSLAAELIDSGAVYKKLRDLVG